MADTFAFLGDDTVGAFVAACMERAGVRQVGDAAEADVAFTYCPTATLLEDAYFDDEGLVKRAHAGAALVDLSPSTPSFARELSAIALVNDLLFVEAPLAVNDPSAEGPFADAGNLVCYAACEEDIPPDVAGLLDRLAAEVVVTGAIGSAQLAKAAHTVQLASHVVSAIEAAALARSTRLSASADGGLSAIQLAEAGLKRSLLASIADGRFEEGYAVRYLMADVVAAMAAADDVELILPQLEAAMHLLELIAVIGGADKGPASLALLYREEAEGAAHGLDWTRAEGLYESHSPDAGEYADDYDGFGFAGGFGEYSEN